MGKLGNRSPSCRRAACGQGGHIAVNLAAEGAHIIALDICADLEGNTYPSVPTGGPRRDGAAWSRRKPCGARPRSSTSASVGAVWKAIADGRGRNSGGSGHRGRQRGNLRRWARAQTIQSWSDTIDTDLVDVFNVHPGQPPAPQHGGSTSPRDRLRAQLGSATNQGPGGSAYCLAKQIVAPACRERIGPRRLQAVGPRLDPFGRPTIPVKQLGRGIVVHPFGAVQRSRRSTSQHTYPSAPQPRSHGAGLRSQRRLGGNVHTRMNCDALTPKLVTVQSSCGASLDADEWCPHDCSLPRAADIASNVRCGRKSSRDPALVARSATRAR